MLRLTRNIGSGAETLTFDKNWKNGSPYCSASWPLGVLLATHCPPDRTKTTINKQWPHVQSNIVFAVEKTSLHSRIQLLVSLNLRMTVSRNRENINGYVPESGTLISILKYWAWIKCVSMRAFQPRFARSVAMSSFPYNRGGTFRPVLPLLTVLEWIPTPGNVR